MKQETKKVFGTKEWAKYNLNCCKGCKNNCLYCYARYNAVKRFKTMKEGEWNTEKVQENMLKKKFGLRNGTTMFPTTHDISPGNLDACLIVLDNILAPGNNVLIVSKPHLYCISSICNRFTEYKEQILFRFTIGASDETILKYWEPNAPTFAERMRSLKYAFNSGYKTSISMEPVLDWPNVVSNFEKMAPFVTDSIWVGALNFIDKRVEIKTNKDREMVDEIKKYQNTTNYEKVYGDLKDHPLVKWKESLKEALGLDIPDEIGMDI